MAILAMLSVNLSLRLPSNNVVARVHGLFSHGGVMANLMWGAHGTCASSAQKIVDEGFVLAPGRAGNGAYFWTMVNDSAECRQLAHRLAWRWAMLAERHGSYRSAEDPSHAVVEVQVSVESADVLSLDEPKIFFRLWSLLRAKIAEKFGVSSDEDWKRIKPHEIEPVVHGGVEFFVDALERSLGRKFKVVFKNQSCKGFEDILMPLLGNHSCFVVRDPKIVVDSKMVRGKE